MSEYKKEGDSTSISSERRTVLKAGAAVAEGHQVLLHGHAVGLGRKVQTHDGHVELRVLGLAPFAAGLASLRGEQPA